MLYNCTRQFIRCAVPYFSRRQEIMSLNKAAISGILLSLICSSVSVIAATVPVDLTPDTNVYTLHTQTVNSQPVTYQSYEDLVYVAPPVDVRYEKMNLYVPEVYYQGETSHGYTAKTAPIFMPGQAAVPGTDFLNGGSNAALYALSRGYMVAAPALRGHTLKNAGGTYTGKAPACIADYKAAARYLRYNQKLLPTGDTRNIISNGTSAGGALSSLLGATGNSKDYEPYITAAGAGNRPANVPLGKRQRTKVGAPANQAVTFIKIPVSGLY